MRPNWDTYRAWAGVVPSRDDMLEMHFNDKKEVEAEKGMQPDARAYLHFMEQIVAAKDNPRPSSRSRRLAMLDIPFDAEDQLRDYLQGKEKQSLTPKEKLEIIKRRVHDVGFYRIRHYPDKLNEMASERMILDGKTAKKAGPSQFAFDQMLSQNMCRVATNLKKNPYFEEFKYALTGLTRCGIKDYEQLLTFFPEGHEKKIKNYYQQQNGQSMRETPSDERRNISSKTPAEVYDMLEQDTQNNQGKADNFKVARHSRFLEKFLTSIVGIGSKKAAKSAKYYSDQITTPYQPGYHAIKDPGGVRGVKEAHTQDVTLTRFLLEPYGVNVEHWSLVNGRDNAYHSYSFSDQFTLLKSQKIFNEIWDNVKNNLKDGVNEPSTDAICQEIKKRSVEALSHSQILANNDNENCIPLNEQMALLTNVSSMANAKLLKQDAMAALKTCLTCHGNNQVAPLKFNGLEEFVKSGESQQFKQFLTSTSPTYQMSYLKVMEHKLGFHGPHDHGSDMPPIPFPDNNDYKNKYQTNDSTKINNLRRKALAAYLINFAQGPSETGAITLKTCGCNPSP